jgi:hypothetical protein
VNGPEHYRAAELLLASCQLGRPDADGTEYYAAGDDPPGSGGPNTLGNALTAAQVHATLAFAAATIAAAPVAESRVGVNWLEVTASRTAAGR